MYIYLKGTIYAYNHEILKRMCPPGYHQIGFVATHELGQIMYDLGTSCPSA